MEYRTNRSVVGNFKSGIEIEQILDLTEWDKMKTAYRTDAIKLQFVQAITSSFYNYLKTVTLAEKKRLLTLPNTRGDCPLVEWVFVLKNNRKLSQLEYKALTDKIYELLPKLPLFTKKMLWTFLKKHEVEARVERKFSESSDDMTVIDLPPASPQKAPVSSQQTSKAPKGTLLDVSDKLIEVDGRFYSTFARYDKNSLLARNSARQTALEVNGKTIRPSDLSSIPIFFVELIPCYGEQLAASLAEKIQPHLCSGTMTLLTQKEARERNYDEDLAREPATTKWEKVKRATEKPSVFMPIATVLLIMGFALFAIIGPWKLGTNKWANETADQVSGALDKNSTLGFSNSLETFANGLGITGTIIVLVMCQGFLWVVSMFLKRDAHLGCLETFDPQDPTKSIDRTITETTRLQMGQTFVGRSDKTYAHYCKITGEAGVYRIVNSVANQVRIPTPDVSMIRSGQKQQQQFGVRKQQNLSKGDNLDSVDSGAVFPEQQKGMTQQGVVMPGDEFMSASFPPRHNRHNPQVRGRLGDMSGRGGLGSDFLNMSDSQQAQYLVNLLKEAGYTGAVPGQQQVSNAPQTTTPQPQANASKHTQTQEQNYQQVPATTTKTEDKSNLPVTTVHIPRSLTNLNEKNQSPEKLPAKFNSLNFQQEENKVKIEGNSETQPPNMAPSPQDQYSAENFNFTTEASTLETTTSTTQMSISLSNETTEQSTLPTPDLTPNSNYEELASVGKQTSRQQLTQQVVASLSEYEKASGAQLKNLNFRTRFNRINEKLQGAAKTAEIKGLDETLTKLNALLGQPGATAEQAEQIEGCFDILETCLGDVEQDDFDVGAFLDTATNLAGQISGILGDMKITKQSTRDQVVAKQRISMMLANVKDENITEENEIQVKQKLNDLSGQLSSGDLSTSEQRKSVISTIEELDDLLQPRQTFKKVKRTDSKHSDQYNETIRYTPLTQSFSKRKKGREAQKSVLEQLQEQQRNLKKTSEEEEKKNNENKPSSPSPSFPPTGQ